MRTTDGGRNKSLYQRFSEWIERVRNQEITWEYDSLYNEIQANEIKGHSGIIRIGEPLNDEDIKRLREVSKEIGGASIRSPIGLNAVFFGISNPYNIHPDWTISPYYATLEERAIYSKRDKERRELAQSTWNCEQCGAMNSAVYDSCRSCGNENQPYAIWLG